MVGYALFEGIMIGRKEEGRRKKEGRKKGRKKSVRIFTCKECEDHLNELKKGSRGGRRNMERREKSRRES